MIKNKKTIVIQDCIMLPAIGWGYDYCGPVMHPTALDDSTIEQLLMSNPPVKFMYALNPSDHSKRVHLTLDNFKLTNEELFNKVPTVNNIVSEGVVSIPDLQPNPNGVQISETQESTATSNVDLSEADKKTLDALTPVNPDDVPVKDDAKIVDETPVNVEESTEAEEEVVESSDEAIVSNDAEFTESEIKEQVANVNNSQKNNIKFSGGKKNR